MKFHDRIKCTSDRLIGIVSLLVLLALTLTGCGGNGNDHSSAPMPIGISAQPVSVSAVVGTAASFSVTATGDGLGYQWQRSTDGGATWVAIASATSATYSIAAVDAPSSGFEYRVIVTGTTSSMTSSPATLTVTLAPTPPTISVQPADQSIVAGGNAAFTVTASGTSLAYQWQSGPDGVTWTDIAGATNATLTIGAVTSADNGRQLRVVVRNTVGSVTSRAATLTVMPAPAAPVVVTQPSSVSVVASATATFTVAASGTPAPGYQWQVSSDGGVTYIDITGATSPSYTTAATTMSDSGKLFRVRVSNAVGQVSSASAALTVTLASVAPAITVQPNSQTVSVGSAATFVVTATGTPAPTAQWQVSLDGGVTFLNITGATGFSYTTPVTALADNGNRYRVTATNNAGATTSAVATLTVTGASGVSARARVATGGQHTCAIKSDQGVACWGANGGGQIGDGTQTSRLVPTDVSGLSNVSDLAAGTGHTCALKLDGSVSCWGNDLYGQLGDNQSGFSARKLSPVSVIGLVNAVAISVGGFHSCALKSDTTVVCWGYNSSGQLGDGSTTDRYAPVAVANLTNVVAISAGYAHTCALSAGGTEYCWGDDTGGATGSALPSVVPAPVNGIASVKTISAGSFYSCASLADASAACWGFGSTGQLGDGTTTTGRYTPAAVLGINAVASLTTAAETACALKADGTVYCWGSNAAGTLGDGTMVTYRTTPGVVPTLSGIVELSRGSYGSQMCAVKADGSVLCWGNDMSGQLGISSSTTYQAVYVPTPVLSLSALR